MLQRGIQHGEVTLFMTCRGKFRSLAVLLAILGMIAQALAAGSAIRMAMAQPRAAVVAGNAELILICSARGLIWVAAPSGSPKPFAPSDIPHETCGLCPATAAEAYFPPIATIALQAPTPASSTFQNAKSFIGDGRHSMVRNNRDPPPVARPNCTQTGVNA